MPTPTETARIAAAISMLRPDWPTASLTTLITTRHAHRPARDLAVALAYVALDADTRTPARINEAGPWWWHGGARWTEGPADRRPCSRCRRVHLPRNACPQVLDPATAHRGAEAVRAAILGARRAAVIERDRIAKAITDATGDLA